MLEKVEDRVEVLEEQAHQFQWGRGNTPPTSPSQGSNGVIQLTPDGGAPAASGGGGGGATAVGTNTGSTVEVLVVLEQLHLFLHHQLLRAGGGGGGVMQILAPASIPADTGAVGTGGGRKWICSIL
jgi:hypothetical protein